MDQKLPCFTSLQPGKERDIASGKLIPFILGQVVDPSSGLGLDQIPKF